MTDPVNHYGTEEPDRRSLYPPHPITRPHAMSVFADARRSASPPPEGVQAARLVGSSQGSLRRPVRADAAAAGDGGTERGRDARGRAAGALARGAGGEAVPPRRGGAQRLRHQCLVPGGRQWGTRHPMVRWLAADPDTPRIRPAAYSLPEISLTHRQMQAIFLVIEVLLPLSVVLAGTLVWWRRRWRRRAAVALLVLAIGLLGGLAATGHWPGGAALQRFDPDGILAGAGAATQVEDTPPVAGALPSGARVRDGPPMPP